MGLFKEMTNDRRICGEKLERNIVMVAACNPAGRNAIIHGSMMRENDLGKEWASGHYQVNELPATMRSLTWQYGALNSSQEKEFVFRRMEMSGHSIPIHLKQDLTELITTSHEAIRDFARKNIFGGLQRTSKDEDIEKNKLRARARAKSSVSLRDIQRVFTIFNFFMKDFPLTHNDPIESMYLTIAVVYYFRLDSDNRKEFICVISKSPSNRNISSDFLSVLDKVMTKVVDELVIPQGTALTTGLKENIFMTVVCSLSFTPLTIIGPPGSSKTLSVNIVSDNANGEESPSIFYRNLPRLSTFHYQCSKTSTSKEVASVFDNAIHRQEKVDPSKHKCLVFMDEAGLPEEEKESLKVLHYYLEGHMSMKAKVGFVAITNHVLDAAKSNRCVSLLRQEPDKDEMMRITNGVLFDSHRVSEGYIQIVRYEDKSFTKEDFSQRLYNAYFELMNCNNREMETFYGLRDFIYFLKFLRRNCHTHNVSMKLSPKTVVHGVERNFNGVEQERFPDIVSIFLSHLSAIKMDVLSMIRQPINVISDALDDLATQTGLKRYTLIIDETEDDSIVRLLHSEGLINISQKCLFKLSKMPENADSEERNLVSGVKYAALKGTRVILSQTDTINESFYDLFNQHFRRVTCRDGTEGLFCNIAIDGVSRRSKVSPSFHSIVHIRKSDLPSLPAPFLNRFEKYRLSVSDVLEFKVKKSLLLERIVFRSMEKIEYFCSIMESKNLCGFCTKDTIRSFLLSVISKMNLEHKEFPSLESSKSFVDHLIDFVEALLLISITSEEVTFLTNHSIKCLPTDQVDALRQLLSKQFIQNPSNMKRSFEEVLGGNPTTVIAELVENIVEMIITQKGIRALVSLATPCAIYSKRLV